MNGNLPLGWAMTTLGAVGRWTSGGTPSRRHGDYFGGDIPWIKTGELRDKLIEIVEENITAKGLANSSAKIFPANTLLVAMYGATIGKLGVLTRPAATNQACAAFMPAVYGSTLVPFLFNYLRACREDLRSKGKGGAQPNLSLSLIQHYPLPLPPLAEQRRIVARLEKLEARSRRARAALDAIPPLLAQARQSLLAAAFRGELSENWRKIHPENREDSLRVIDSTLPSIPSSWVWAKLPELGEVNRGKSRHRPRNAPELYGGPYPFIQTGDIAQSNGRITSHRQTYSKKGLAQSRLWPATTVCITIAANIAESALLTFPACFPDSVVGIIAKPQKALPEFLEFFIRVAKRDLSAFAPATAQKNINLAILNDLAIPLPSLAEQREIVRRLESALARLDATAAAHAAAVAELDRLDQSLLAQAFSGKLVKQSSADEPASALLARIRAETADGA